MSGWRPSLRIARRSVLRSPWRSLVITIIVAVPVAGVTMADIAARTLSSSERSVERKFGSADAIAVVTAFDVLPAEASRNAYYAGTVPGPDTARRDPAALDLEALLPAGARAVRTYSSDGSQPIVSIATSTRTVRTDIFGADPTEPLDRHVLRLTEGSPTRGADEILLTSGLAHRLHVDVGDTVQVGESKGVRVRGLARNPFCHSCDYAFVARGSALLPAAPQSTDARYLLDLPENLNVSQLADQLAGKGVLLVSRAEITAGATGGIGDAPVTTETVQTAAIGLLGAGLALLEIVLLAGAAFAVGVRRQTRDIGLIAVGGGSPRDVRRVVLAQGLVLGIIGAALGVVVGIAAMPLGSPLWERVIDQSVDSWTHRPLDIAGAALIGIGSGFAAAFIPAVGAARMRVVDALAGRAAGRGSTRSRAPKIGVALLAIGVTVSLVGERQLSSGFDDYRRQLAQVRVTGNYLSTNTTTGAVLVVLIGAALVASALVVLMPHLLGWLGRIGGRMPLSGRLAVRDASRNRHRSGPATTAIAIAVTGTIVLLYTTAGTVAAVDARYVPRVASGSVLITPAYDTMSTDSTARNRAFERLEGSTRSAFPGASIVPLRTLMKDCSSSAARQGSCAPNETSAFIPGYEQDCISFCSATSNVAVVDDDLTGLEQLAGSSVSSADRTALRAGSALVFSRQIFQGTAGEDGTTRISNPGANPIETNTTASKQAEAPLDGTIPARLVVRKRAYTALPSVLVTETTARSLNGYAETQELLVTPKVHVTRSTEDTVRTSLDKANGDIYVERGPPSGDDRVTFVILGIAALVTLIGVAITVTLSAAEGRADLATMAAVGAPPRRRRAIVAAQALLVSTIGVVCGIVFGSFFAFVSRSAIGAPEFTIPWRDLGIVLVAAPVLAVLVAGLFTPSRFPLQRRMEE